MERVVRIFGSHKAADAADPEYYLSLTPAQRMQILWEIVQDYPAESGPLNGRRTSFDHAELL